MGRITDEDRTAVRRIYRKVRADLTPAIARIEQANPGLPADTAKTLIAQNAMRVCLEVVLRECLPYDQHFLAELGVRLAAYCVTAAPIETHERLSSAVAASIGAAVTEKVRQGAVIHTDWRIPGEGDRPNLPRKADIN